MLLMTSDENVDHLSADAGERSYVARSNMPPKQEGEERECDMVDVRESRAGVVDVHGRRNERRRKGGE